MAQICEITRKRVPHLNNMPQEGRPEGKVYQRSLLKRTVKVPEIKGSINLKVTEEGLKQIKQAGGLAKYLKDQDDKKLIPKLLKLKRKIHGEPKDEKAENASESPASEEKPAS